MRSPLLRYLPLAGIVIIQILIISIAPSKSPAELTALGGGNGGAESFADQDFTADDLPEGVTIDPVTGQPVTGGGGRGSAAGGAGGSAADGTAAGGVTGDIGHCVGDRQFDPALYPFSPACVGKWAGGNNGGATYRGVSGDRIKIIKYLGNLGEAVDALLTAQGANAGKDNHDKFAAAVQDFAAKRYELYGRKIDLKVIQGRCKSVPPDYTCLRNEMREIVQRENPFWVNWHTSLASPAFDELSRLKVMNSGGWGFRDIFNQQRRPYHWDLLMGGTQQMQHIANWYCKRMHGGKAEHAGSASIQARDRVLGVISTDDPENRLAIRDLKSMLADCGATVAKEYYYAQDINTAQQQRDAAVRKMRENPEATTIICFCDLVAPIFLYQTCEEQQYYPEHVIVGSGYMDADAAAQAYDNTLPPQGRQFHNAFGLAQQPKAEFWQANTATRVWQDSGRSGAIPHQAMTAEWDHYAMILALLQSAGPNLNPFTVEAGAHRLGALNPGGARDEYMNPRGFARGDYTWIKGMREVYWSTQQVSPFNRNRGTYMTLNGGRWFQPGEYPSGLLKLPPKPR